MPYFPEDHDWATIPSPDPARKYRWLADDPRRLAGHLRSFGKIPGYRLESRAYPKPVGDVTEKDTTWGLAKQLGLDPEAYVDVARNRIVYHHCVLGSIPIEEYHRRVDELRARENDRAEGIESSYMAAVERRGVRPFKRTPEEIADRQEFATRPSANRVSLSTPRQR